jgi:phosphatidylinositol-4-phosphate 3-kinase
MPGHTLATIGNESDVVLEFSRIHLDGADVDMLPPCVVLREPEVLPSRPSQSEAERGEQQRAREFDRVKRIVREATSRRTIGGKNFKAAKLADSDLKLMWELRKYILSIDGGIWVLLSVPGIVDWSDPFVRFEARNWLEELRKSNPAAATAADVLQLLSANHRDPVVRKFACDVLGAYPEKGKHCRHITVADEEFLAFLPQLVQAVKHEQHFQSDLAGLLLKRAMGSLSITHAIFWELRTELDPESERAPLDWVHRRREQQTEMVDEWDGLLANYLGLRYQLLLEAVLLGCGRRVRAQLLKQVALIRQFNVVAHEVTLAKEASRHSVFRERLQAVRLDPPFSLPLDPGLMLDSVVVSESRIFASKTLPFLVSLNHADIGTQSERANRERLRVIFKAGDDLRQDILITQMIATFARMW